jgi:hypothetical protein
METEQHPGDWIPATEDDRRTVLRQLERMLESPLFRNSKRYPNLLRYLVEQTLSGNEDLLKERLLGISVFHRPPDYDTNQDTVVRLTAGEVRKRIAQYYHQPEHAAELQIDLRPGSYVAHFRSAGESNHLSLETQLHVENSSPAPCDSFALQPHTGTEFRAKGEMEALDVLQSAAKSTRKAHLPWIAAAVTAFLLAGGAFFWWQSTQGELAADRQLWAPILSEPGQVRLVLADLSATLSQTQELPSNQFTALASLLRMGELVNYRDIQAQSGIVAYLAQHNKPYVLALSTQATYPDLQRGASVLIGGLDNVWTMRVTDSLRYHFVQLPDSYVFAIQDRRHAEQSGWHVDLAPTSSTATEDYALVARIFDQTTGRPVLVVAGLGANGTAAAAQFLLDPARTAELAAHAPRNWQRMNMEAVLRTQILDNHAGPPRLVACTFW